MDLIEDPDHWLFLFVYGREESNDNVQQEVNNIEFDNEDERKFLSVKIVKSDELVKTRC